MARKPEAARRAAAQMQRDGIHSLTPKQRRENPCTVVAPRHCDKRARYSTPLGDRCFGHAVEISSARQS